MGGERLYSIHNLQNIKSFIILFLLDGCLPQCFGSMTTVCFSESRQGRLIRPDTCLIHIFTEQVIIFILHIETLANSEDSEDPDKMSHQAAFCEGLHC